MVKGNNNFSKEQLEDLVIETDSGARRPTNIASAIVLIGVAFLWSVFQIVVESSIPSQLTVFF